jgi:hypothetical protein
VMTKTKAQAAADLRAAAAQLRGVPSKTRRGVAVQLTPVAPAVRRAGAGKQPPAPKRGRKTPAGEATRMERIADALDPPHAA